MPKKPGTEKPQNHSAAIMATGHRRIRQDHARELAEDYVELIENLIEETGEARAVDLADRLGVTHVTVTKTVARLLKEGWVVSEPYRAIFLTDKGKKLANRARKRHQRVLEFLLALGIPPEIAQADTEGIEHHVSPVTLQAMKKFLERKQSEQ